MGTGGFEGNGPQLSTLAFAPERASGILANFLVAD
jgi:hypothetical protein